MGKSYHIHMRFALIFLALLAFPACAETQSDLQGQPIKSIYWSDGDSGRLTLQSGEVIKFRLKDVDAPETGGVGAAIGPAQCEDERELGFAAKEFMVDLSRQPLVVSGHWGADRFDRELVSLTVRAKEPTSPTTRDTQDATAAQALSTLAIQAGHLRPWDYDGGQRKPDWCFPPAQ